MFSSQSYELKIKQTIPGLSLRISVIDDGFLFAEFVETGLDDELRLLWWFLAGAVLGFGESSSGGGRRRRRRRRPLVPVEHHCDSALVVHDFPRWRLIVQLQCVDRFAYDLRYSRNSCLRSHRSKNKQQTVPN